MSSSDRNFHLVTVNLFLWRQIYSCECDGKFIPITGIVFLWWEIFSCGRKFLPAIQNSLLWHKIPYFDRKFLLVSMFFVWLLFSSCFHFTWTQLNFLRQNVVILAKILCEPGSQVPRENPTLGASCWSGQSSKYLEEDPSEPTNLKKRRKMCACKTMMTKQQRACKNTYDDKTMEFICPSNHILKSLCGERVMKCLALDLGEVVVDMCIVPEGGNKVQKTPRQPNNIQICSQWKQT